MCLLLEVIRFALGGQGFFCGENAGDARSDFMMDDSFVVFAYDINTEFLRIC